MYQFLKQKMTRQLASITLAAGIAALPATLAAADDYAKFKDQRYDLVRGELIDEYWKPASPGCESSIPYLCGVYPELEDCAGTGAAPCIFWWRSRDGKTTLKVYTMGEVQRMVRKVKTAP